MHKAIGEERRLWYGDAVRTLTLSVSALVAVTLSFVSNACTTEVLTAPSGAITPDTDAGAADAGDSTMGQPGTDVLTVDPATACPAAFTGSGKGPKAGANTGFSVAGQTRAFRLLVPPASFTGPRPLFLAFHGTGETGASFINRADLTELSARGFFVVAPNAVGNGSFWPVWDAMRMPGTESAKNPDVELFDTLVTCMAAHYEIDKNRIFAGGHSAGGIFTNRLLRSRSDVLAGGIVGSGVFDFTRSTSTAPLDSMLAIVTWGGDNDQYAGTTPNGVTVPAFNFVEQASLASKHYSGQSNVAHVRCRGNDVGHAWLPLNDWFADLMLAHPKGTPASSLTLPSTPASAPVECTTDPYDLAPLPDMTCSAGTRSGCQETCQLFADCAVENRTVGPSISGELSDIGFTSTSCSQCVQKCDAAANGADDATVLSCFKQKQAAATCGAGIEGAMPLFQTVNLCCNGKTDSKLCVDLCTTLLGNSAASAFFPACKPLVP
jgi:poly(3-hydroxybutyrate) depolymerase